MGSYSALGDRCLVGPEEVAKYFGVSIRTARRLMRDKMKSLVVGRHLRVSVGELRRFEDDLVYGQLNPSTLRAAITKLPN